MKNSITIFLSFFFINVIAQNKEECSKLLSKEVLIERNSIENFKKDFSNFEDCGIDAIDLEIFSDNSILSTIIITLASENKKITYGDLLNQILDVKKTEQYSKIRDATIISKEFSTKIARIENWNEDKIKLKKLEISEDYLTKMFNYIKENSNSKNYKEIFNILNETQNKNRNDNLKKSEEYSGLFENKGNINLEDLLKEASNVDKPLIIYFTGYSNINSRKIEKNILIQDTIYKRLENQFYFVSLYLDDKKQLPNTEQFTSASTGILIKTMGQKHSNLQIEKFNVNVQPYFVMLDSKGNTIATQGYLTDENDFIIFLNKGSNVK